jgi:hypothetical protein
LFSVRNTPDRDLVHCAAMWAGVGSTRAGMPCLDHVVRMARPRP